MSYIDPEVLRDEVACADLVLSEIASRLDGWEAHEGSVETSLAEAVGIVAATSNDLLVDEARDVYAGFANNVLGLYRAAAAPSSASATFTLKDDTGWVVPAGTLVTVEGPDGAPVTFGTVGDWAAPAGETTLANVPVTSLEAGAAMNNVAGTAFIETGVAGVVSAVIPVPSAGGADEEPLQDFLDRVARRARMFRVLPVTAGDYAALALDHPSVGRALAVNLLDPANPPAPGSPPASGGHVTVYVVDGAGAALTGPVMAEVQALLEAPGRVSNVVVHVAAPSYVTVDAALTVWAGDGFNTPDVVASAVAAATDYLRPARWGRDNQAPGLWAPPDLAAEREVTALGVAHEVASMMGVGGVASCTVNGGAAVPLPGFATLPTPGTITATPAT